MVQARLESVSWSLIVRAWYVIPWRRDEGEGPAAAVVTTSLCKKGSRSLFRDITGSKIGAAGLSGANAPRPLP